MATKIKARKEGPGAPSKLADPVTTTMRIERAALEKLRWIAYRRGRKLSAVVSVADIAREAVDEYLRAHPVTPPTD
jgi:hypothetical protein